MSPPAQQIIGAALLFQHSSRYFLEYTRARWDFIHFPKFMQKSIPWKNEITQWENEKKTTRILDPVLFYEIRFSYQLNGY